MPQKIYFLNDTEAKIKYSKDISFLQKILISRPAETFFATGIPIIGFVSAIFDASSFWGLSWFFPLIIFTGYHILAVNDLNSDAKPFNKKIGEVVYFIPIFFVPVLIVNFLFFNANPNVSYILLFIVLNWDIYSIYGKKKWFISLASNFFGGVLHFLLGVAAVVSSDFLFNYLAGALFFGSAMVGASMHHDASHFSEDLLGGFETGAVRFGYDTWWQYGIFPMIISVIPLYFCAADLCLAFSFALVGYFLAYIFFNSVFSGRYYELFRCVCRIIFGFAGATYIIARLIVVYFDL